MLVVRATKQADEIRIMDVGAGKALDVIEFEPTGFEASSAVLVDEGAPAAVALEDDRLMGRGCPLNSTGRSLLLRSCGAFRPTPNRSFGPSRG